MQMKRMPKTSIKVMRLLIWTYTIFIAASWLFLYQGGDRWWPATLILFGPRWLFSLPLLILVPLTAWLERRYLIVLAFAAAILFIPFMGLCVPWKTAVTQAPTIRVLSCNIGGNDTDMKRLKQLIQTSNADIVVLQDCKNNAPINIPPRWKFIRTDEFIVASHYPINLHTSYKSIEPVHNRPKSYFLQCQIRTPLGELSVTSIHLPSPHKSLSSLLDRNTILNLSKVSRMNEQMAWRNKASREISQFLQKENLPKIIAGDFNMPVESVFYRRYWSNYTNAFSEAGFGYGLTVKAIIRGFEHRIRIDHILTQGPLAVENCHIGEDIGSDHLPVIAEIRRIH
jgi:vancomycin resistance protein VanJ